MEMPENHYILFFKKNDTAINIIPYKIRQEIFASKNRSALSVEYILLGKENYKRDRALSLKPMD